MKNIMNIVAIAMAVSVVIPNAAIAESDFLLHGRISFDTGSCMVRGSDAAEWSAALVNTLIMPGDTVWVDQSGTAEIELADASFLRMADGSKAEMVSLPPKAFVRGWAGSFYVHRLSRSQGEFIFSTPSSTITIDPDAMVRIDIDNAGAATVSVRWGRASVRTDQGGESIAGESMRVWVDPGLLPSDPVAFDRAQNDAFDDWNNERARLLAEGARTTPKEVLIQNNTVGSSDLGRYGEWVYIDTRPYWRPTVVMNYVPYRYGYWNYASGIGHVWVDEYPFAYITTHYGRWRHTVSYGWVWSYDPVWSPAWVASVRVGDYYLWAPVDYYYRPVVMAHSSVFVVGGVSFCSFSASYVSASYVYAGPSYVYAPTTVVVNSFRAAPPSQVNVWRITPDARRRPEVPYDAGSIAGERDYNPSRSIRGVQGDAAKGIAPNERARKLEENLGRKEFIANRPESGRSVRTATDNRERIAGSRQVRLDRTEQTYLSSNRTDSNGTGVRSTLETESTRLGRMTRPTPEATGPDRQRGERPALSDTLTVGEQNGRIGVRDSKRTSSGTESPREALRRGTDEQTGTLRNGTHAASGTGAAAPTTPRDQSIRNTERSSIRGRDVALRDMESAAPAPSNSIRSGITPERTPIKQEAAPSIRNTAPSSGVRRSAPSITTSPSPVRQSAPSATQRPSAPSITTSPSPVRQSAPSATQRPSAPSITTSPSPIRQSTPSATQRRSATSITTSPSPVRQSAPSTTQRRSAPSITTSPSPIRQSAPSATQRRSAPSITKSPSPIRQSAPAIRPNVSSGAGRSSGSLPSIKPRSSGLSNRGSGGSSPSLRNRLR